MEISNVWEDARRNILAETWSKSGTEMWNYISDGIRASGWRISTWKTRYTIKEEMEEEAE